MKVKTKSRQTLFTTRSDPHCGPIADPPGPKIRDIDPEKPRRRHEIRIAITPIAFERIAATLPLGSVGYEAETTAKG
jgi:hypothetical protein